MKIAITGASGKLGSKIVKQLLKVHPKIDIIALARTVENALHLGVEVRGGDYDNFEQLKESLKDIDCVLLVSGMDEPNKRVIQHQNVINASKECGVKKIVYTSIQGLDEGTGFSPIVYSNRKTEEDIKNSSLEWVIGRNGIYIEPDVEYIKKYQELGEVVNCAGDGLCGYTTREELAYAYAKMILEDKHNDRVYNLHGDSITQNQLVDFLNDTFDLKLKYKYVNFNQYKKDRILELGEFIGEVVAGIYDGIKKGHFNNSSDFKAACGRPHQSLKDYFLNLRP